MSTAVFQNSRLHILFAIVLAVCAVPVAFGLPFLWPIMLVPVGVVVWVLRVRTTVDAEAVTVRRIVGSRRVPWSQISTLHLSGPNGSRHRVSAVLSDGAELPLPATRVRDLPQLAAASGGRLPDPAGD
ncbi:MAG: PH domain-containing protein [Pseudonocardia sp.]|nr:PH domain-containing protein [Pseudonocardia sp.]